MKGEFNYLPINRVTYGKGSSGRINSILSETKKKKVLIVTSSSVSKTGAFNKILNTLGTDFFIMNQITQHSPMEEIEHAVEMYRNNSCDSILSIGGGSVTDASKVVKYYYDINALHIAIPTTLSASEFSHIAGYSIGGEKDGIRDKRIAPQEVILDPEMTRETPEKLWRSTGIRSLDHCVETLIHGEIAEISKKASLMGIKKLFDNLESDDLDSKLQCQIASWYSYFQVYDSSMGISHNIGKVVGAKFEIPHGITSCITLPVVMKYYAKQFPDVMREIASTLSGKNAQDEDPENASFLVQEFLNSLNLNDTLSNYGVKITDAEYIYSKLKNKEPWHMDLIKELIRET
ncbi:MAG: iron-containing alcohol dehydrogenase [Cuniculiplasma sp.]